MGREPGGLCQGLGSPEGEKAGSGKMSERSGLLQEGAGTSGVVLGGPGEPAWGPQGRHLVEGTRRVRTSDLCFAAVEFPLGSEP